MLIYPDRRSVARPQGWAEHARTTLTHSIWQTSTHHARALIAVSSVLWAVGVWSTPDLFALGPYGALLQLVDVPAFWGWLFFAAGCLLLWRLFDPRTRTRLGLWVNGYAAALWVGATIVASLHGPRTSLSSDYVLCVLALWMLYKTGARAAVVAPEGIEYVRFGDGGLDDGGLDDGGVADG